MLAAYGVTHRGQRPTNEDGLLVDVRGGLFVVADGMGGHNAGEVASELAVHTMQHALGETPTDTPAAALERAVRFANEQILAAAQSRSDYSGMGTTVSAVLASDDRVAYISVGDSRIYVLRGGRLTQLTEDDSWLSSAVAGGMPLTAAEMREHPLRHVLTEVVGVRPDLQPRADSRELLPGDVLLLCSDGLHGAVPDDALTAMLGTRGSVADIAEELVAQALARGATDNVTAVVVRRES